MLEQAIYTLQQLGNQNPQILPYVRFIKEGYMPAQWKRAFRQLGIQPPYLQHCEQVIMSLPETPPPARPAQGENTQEQMNQAAAQVILRLQGIDHRFAAIAAEVRDGIR